MLKTIKTSSDLRRKVKRINEAYRQAVINFGEESPLAQQYRNIMLAAANTHETSSGYLAIDYKQEADESGNFDSEFLTALDRLDKLDRVGAHYERLKKDRAEFMSKFQTGASGEDESIPYATKEDLRLFEKYGDNLNRIIELHWEAIYEYDTETYYKLKNHEPLTPKDLHRMYRAIEDYYLDQRMSAIGHSEKRREHQRQVRSMMPF